MLSLIAALSDNYCIGKDGKMPWHLPGDLRRFQRWTRDHAVIMGRATWESIPSPPLPDRINIVVTRDTTWQPDCLVFVKHDLDAALKLAECVSGDTFIIGGASLYSAYMRRAQRMYLTRVHCEIEGGDTFFPHWSLADWELMDAIPMDATPDDPHDRTYERWERIDHA